MREEPLHRIHPNAMKVWKIHAWIFHFILFMIIIGYTIVAFLFSYPFSISIIAIIFSIVTWIIFTWLIPNIRYRRWRYEIFSEEIYVQHGIIIVKRTIVPMNRVQHVDTKQGPILKKYNLASITISTAAATHEIPALLEADADRLRDNISTLARVDDEDV